MREAYRDVTLLLTRLAFGAYFIVAAIGKFRGGVSTFVEGYYRQMQPEWLPNWFATPFGYALPFVETAVGTLLAIGLFTRVTASVMVLMLIAFTIATTVFHEALPFHPNVVYLVLALLFTALGPGRISVDHFIGRRKPVRA